MHNTVTQAESSSYGAGGVMATTGGWGLSWLYVEDCDVTTAGRAAGGISAYNDSYTQCVVKTAGFRPKPWRAVWQAYLPIPHTGVR